MKHIFIRTYKDYPDTTIIVSLNELFEAIGEPLYNNDGELWTIPELKEIYSISSFDEKIEWHFRGKSLKSSVSANK